MQVKEIRIRNFKSLRDAKIDLSQFNVLVGENLTGKTNLVDAFILLRKIYAEHDVNPFSYWWGYNNAVWKGREELPIIFEIYFKSKVDKKTYTGSFNTVFTGVGGRFEIIKESLKIDGILNLEREGEYVTINREEKYLNELWEGIKKGKRKWERLIKTMGQTQIKMNRKILGFESIDDLLSRKNEFIEQVEKHSSKRIFDLSKYEFEGISITGLPIGISITSLPFYKTLPAFSSFVKEEKLLLDILHNLYKLIFETTILKLNVKGMKMPSPARKEETLLEDGSNLNTVLYNLFLKQNRIPESIISAFSYLFPNIEIKFSLTDDQRVYVRLFENGLELPPPCIADGLYKILAILTALELKPSILVIDEVENSLHLRALECIFDEFKNSESIVIITTHSPAIVDMTDLKELVLVEKVMGETGFERLKRTEEVKKRLKRAGITYSEGWLYGQLKA